jgi:hypothetical protein
MKKPSQFIVAVGLVALVIGSMAGVANAVKPPHPEHPVHPVHPKLNPTVGTTTVDAPITCNFGPGSPIVNEMAHVSVTSPSSTQPNAPYDTDFLLTIDDIVAPADVESFTVTSTYGVSGAVSPSGSISFTQAPQSIPSGGSPTFDTFTQTFTPGPHTTISYEFDAVSYDFKFASTDTIHADCTLDNGPVVVRTTDT